MPIPLPELDDLDYAGLLDEARTLLPALAPAWTNHNPSDPGITLLELFAWLAEMLVWRTGQLSDDTVRGFLALLNGPGWKPGADLEAEVRATVAGLREGYRAVTPDDYERLAAGAFNAWRAEAAEREAAGQALAEWHRVAGAVGEGGAPPSAVRPVARARCVPRRWLGAPDEAGRAADRPGRVSVLVVPPRSAEGRPPPLSAAAPPRADDATRRAVWGFLEERRLLSTRVHVVAPVYVPVRVEAVVVRRPDVPDPAPPETLLASWDTVPAADVRRGVLAALAEWLDPLEGGPGGGGWPFGRDVHVSDLYGVLEAVPGVDYVVDLRLSSSCAGEPAGCVAAPAVVHPGTGEQVGLALAAHHLPQARLRAGDVHVAATVVPVRVEVSLTLAAGAERDVVERGVAGAVRARFAPLEGGPTGSAAVDVAASAVRAAVRALPGVNASQFVHVRLHADPARLHLASDPEHQAVRFQPREIAAAELAFFTDGRRLWM